MYAKSRNRECRSEHFDLEQPALTVTNKGCWIDRTEATNGQYIENAAWGTHNGHCHEAQNRRAH
jgi:formylglycine-generating enzyme required for sulfatase activity